MYPLKAKFKIGGLILIIGVNLLFGLLTWTVYSNTNFLDMETWRNGSSLFFLLFTGIGQFLLLMLLMTQCRIIILTDSSIKFVNPIFPFIVKEYNWADFDYCKSVEEYSKHGTYEAIWFIKDGKLNKRISSFYYSNYGAIKRHIKTPYKGKLKMNPFKQAYYLLGGRI
jgi:hypothetical protein